MWKEQSNDNVRTQITVFWVAAMLGIAFAMALTGSSSSCRGQDQLWPGRRGVLRTAASATASCGSARYIILDRWIFKATHHGEEPHAEELAELHHDFPI